MGVKLVSSSGGSVEIAAPTTASNFTLTAPAATGTILNDVSSLAAANLTGNVSFDRLASQFLSNASLASSGYQKLPSGLIIQWGIVAYPLGHTSVTVTYPITFPSSAFRTVISQSDGAAVIMGMSGQTSSQFTAWTSSAGYNANWIAIGH
jgi:hypothetical protein